MVNKSVTNSALRTRKLVSKSPVVDYLLVILLTSEKTLNVRIHVGLAPKIVQSFVL